MRSSRWIVSFVAALAVSFALGCGGGGSGSAGATSTATAPHKPTFSVVLLDDKPDPFDKPPPPVPKGISQFQEVVVLSPEDIQQRTFVRLVVQPGETLDQARARAKPWFDAIPLPPGDRLLYSTIEEENEITKKREAVGVRTFIGTSTVVLTHDDVGDAGMDAAPDPEGKPQVFAMIQLNPNATERFRQFTKNNPLRRIAIMFDDNVIMSARIEGEITGGQLRISLDPEAPFDARKAEIQEIVSALKPAKPGAVPSGTGGR